MTHHTKAFTISSALKFGWESFKKQPYVLIGIVLTFFAIELAFLMVERQIEQQSMFAWTILVVVRWVVELGISLGLYSILLHTAKGKRPIFSELFSKFDPKLLWKYMLASLMLGLPIMALVIPGMLIFSNRQSFEPAIYVLLIPVVVITYYLSLRFGFYVFVLLEKNVSAFESLKESAEITNGHMMLLFLLSLALFVLNILGVFALVVGTLVTTPVSMLASAYAYHQLAKK